MPMSQEERRRAYKVAVEGSFSSDTRAYSRQRIKNNGNVEVKR